MNRSFSNWKKPGLRAFFALMLMGAVAGLSACGSGGGGGAGSTGNAGNGFGVLTISGNDTTALGTIYSPTSVPVDTAGELTWTSPPPGGALNKPLNAVGTGDRIDLSIEFLTTSQPIGAMEKVTVTYVKGQDKKVYLCDVRANAIDTPCKGNIVQDKAANTVTFTNLEIAVDTDPRIQINTATGPIILNGTLSTKSSASIPGTGTSGGGATTHNAGSVTASGNDIGGVLTPSGFGQSEGPNSVTRSWLSSTMALTIDFNLDGTIINSILVFAGNSDLKYMCGGSQASCTGITQDFSAKSVTFNGTVFGPFSNSATAPVTINGTLKYTDSGTQPSGETPTGGTGTGGGAPDDGTPTGGTGTGKARSISAGLHHICALLTDGRVKCWGDNGFHGNLGNGTTGVSPKAVLVSGITTAAAVEVSTTHTCALLANGRVKCWGDNLEGQLGNGSTVDSSTPVLVSGITTATAVKMRYGLTCALLANGTVKCWGRNHEGQLGNGTTVASPTPTLVSGITTATAIVVGHDRCALLADGTVKCWGNGSSIPGQVNLSTTAKTVVSGEHHTCALLTNGTVECWGNNPDGQLGNGTTVFSTTPVQVVGITTATAVIPGIDRTCAVLADVTLKCWGKNDIGQLGNGTEINSSIPVQVLGITDVITVSHGPSYTCALLTGGTVKCWGSAGQGQLGTGISSVNNSTTPVLVTDITTAKALESRSSFFSSCALLIDGSVKCWGQNGTGFLGNGIMPIPRDFTTLIFYTPTDVVGL